MPHRRTPVARSLVIASLALALSIVFPLGIPLALAQAGAPTHSPAEGLLPADFAGWSLTEPLKPSTSAAAADPSNVDVLTEDGFTQFATADYARNGGKLNVRALRFQDASGAYAAYTFYRHPGMRQEDIGLGAANDGTHILFWQGATVINATFDHLSAMSASELRELAQMLTPPPGSAAVPPSLPRYLPTEGIAPTKLISLSTHYALGPQSYVRSGGVLPTSLVAFDRGAEVLSATYAGKYGDGTLTLINYPTPQLAAERQRAIQAFFKAGNPGTALPGQAPSAGQAAAWSQPLAESTADSLICRRSGPIVAVTSGSLPADESRKIVNQVNYLAEITSNDPKGYNSEVAKTGKILLSIAALSAMLCAAALVIGVFLGGARALLRRLMGKPVSTLNDTEFISLRLDKD